MSIHGYIWLCIENKEEITVEEEETTPSTENPLAGNCFYFDICGTEPDSLLQHKASPGAFATSLLFLNLYHLI
jgi:hypothetical protein